MIAMYAVAAPPSARPGYLYSFCAVDEEALASTPAPRPRPASRQG